MNMRKIVCLFVLAGVALLMAQEAAAPKLRKKRRVGTGPGTEMVTAPAVGPRLRIVNMQQRVPASVLADIQNIWHHNVWLHSDVVRGTRAEAMADGQCGLAICLTDKPGEELLLVSPEGGWAEVNVAALAKDNPSPEVLAKRTKRELWRALAYGMGVGNETIPSILTHVASLQDLDKIEYDEPTPDAYNQIIYWAAKRKMARVRRTTYRQACREGWAPAPTNDVQKAVWEQIKADKERGPTNPITIAPPNVKKQ